METSPEAQRNKHFEGEVFASVRAAIYPASAKARADSSSFATDSFEQDSQ
jgi:hypothetical protein